MWKKFIRDYFTFTRRERNGMLVLLFIMVAVIIWPSVYGLLHKEDPADFTAFQREIDSFQQQIRLAKMQPSPVDSSSVSLAEPDGSSGQKTDQFYSAVLFPFDPNTASADDLKKLGLRSKTVQTIMNYRAKGGRFFNNEDLLKIFSFSQEDYDRLSPYIQITSQELRTKKTDPVASKKETASADHKKIIELNEADSSQLTSLSGIGPVLSSRIIKYRNKLGGFAATDQLKEVYGLSPETFDQIKNMVSVNASEIEKIKINTVLPDQLKQHPYFKHPVAGLVISYRDEHGPFNSPEELKNIDVITEEIYQKMLPYLEF